MQKEKRKPLKENSNYTCYNKSLKNKKQGKKHRASLREQQSQKDFENTTEILSLLSQGLFM